VSRLRNEDQLLLYLVQARNTDEHTIQGIVGKQAACLTITGGIKYRSWGDSDTDSGYDL
jgi:hypothetical protein